MTVIENTNPKVQYNGPVTVGEDLPINFPYSNPEDVKVVIGDTALVYNEDYTVYNQKVTTKVAVDKDSTITIYRETPLDQQVAFPQNSRFNSAKINEALDKLCMQQQEQAEIIDRCIKFNIASSYNQPSLPNPQANNTLIWDKEGAALKNYDIIGENNAFKEGINKEMADNQAATEARFEQFSSETDAQIAANKADTDAQIETFEAETTASIAEFKAETNTSIETFKADINESLDEVLEAAAKVNQLEEAVETASTAATNATNAANNAIASASAAEQVALETQQLLQETTEEIDKTLGEATELIEEFQETIDTRANKDLSNLSEEGENKFAKTEDLVEVDLDAKANTDLSNLSEEGEAHFDNRYVNKSGDTMTGDLTIEDSDPYLNFKDRTTDSSVAPSTFQNLGSVFVRDKNHQVTGYFQNSMTAQNLVQTTIGARRRIDGTELTSSLALAVDSSGTALFAFPQCTTKPTTTSSARGNKVAVVTQNYLNGSSWYRVWSDGFIEQGGAIQNANTPISITFAKTFTDANSVRVLFNVVNTGNTQAYCLNEIPTVSGFKIFRYGGSTTTPYANWYACGY